MKILDVNILIYAVNKDAPLHNGAKAWLERTLSGSEAVGLSWNVLLAFLRLTTRKSCGSCWRHSGLVAILLLTRTWLHWRWNAERSFAPATVTLRAFEGC